jgi:hypothetical protein
MYLPGLPEACAQQQAPKNVRVIEGTSDVVLGYEHAKLIAIAQAYARHYNSALFYLLENEGREVPPTSSCSRPNAQRARIECVSLPSRSLRAGNCLLGAAERGGYAAVEP